MGFETDENTTFIADNILSEVTSDNTITANNAIHLKINETTIYATSDTIILKAGGIVFSHWARNGGDLNAW